MEEENSGGENKMEQYFFTVSNSEASPDYYRCPEHGFLRANSSTNELDDHHEWAIQSNALPYEESPKHPQYPLSQEGRRREKNEVC